VGNRQIKFAVAGLRMATRGKADPSLRQPHERLFVGPQSASFRMTLLGRCERS
jgi:hypothetical protein